MWGGGAHLADRGVVREVAVQALLPEHVEIVIEAEDEPARCHDDHHHFASCVLVLGVWRVQVARRERHGLRLAEDDARGHDLLPRFGGGPGEARARGRGRSGLRREEEQLEAVRDHEDLARAVAVEVGLRAGAGVAV